MTPQTLRRFAIALLLALCTACGAGGVLGSHPPGAAGPTGPPRPPVPPPVPSPASSGIVALCAGDGVVRVDYTLPGTGFEAALFSGASRASVFTGSPELEGLTGNHVILTGRSNGVFEFFGFGIRAAGEPAWTPVGPVVDCRPLGPYNPASPAPSTWYVDAASTAPDPDGRTPATAFSNLVDALLVAFINNGGDVWVAAGNYANGPFPVGADVHVFGGFDSTFDLDARQPQSGGTQLIASRTHLMVDMSSGSQDGVLDGITCDGGNVMSAGVVVTDSNCQLRSVAARRFLNRGIEVRPASTTTVFQSRRIVVLASSGSENGLEGLLVSNLVADVLLDRCHFAANGAEGIDCNDLKSMDDNTSRLTVTGCTFADNLSTGLRADLSLVSTNSHVGGGFDVRIDGCRCERNGADGMFLDQQYDGFPEWTTQIRVRDCFARANRLNGVRIHADQPGTYLVSRLRSTANQADGLLVTSKTDPGEVVVSASWFAGNRGYGVRNSNTTPGLQGTKRLMASHCAFAGNQLGGFLSDQGEGSATSCIALLQGAPWTSVRTRSCFVAAAAADDPFFVAPELIAVATDGANGAFTLQTATPFAIGSTAELADDGLALTVTAAAGTSLVVTPVPTTFIPPDILFGFPGTSVNEDLRLIPGSAALGTAMAPAGVTLDPGPHGSPSGGAPGVYDPLAAPVLRLLATSPHIADGVLATTPVTVTFDRAVDPTAVAGHVRCVGSGGEIPVVVSVAGAAITLTPTGPGWTGAFVVELHAGLRGTDGTTFGHPLVLPLSVR